MSNSMVVTLVGENVVFEQRLTEKQVKTFLDIVVLAILNGRPMHGYQIIAAVHKEFGILLSPGSLYPLLHALDSNRLVESRAYKGKTVYQVTLEGKEKFERKMAAYKFSVQTITNFLKTRGENP